MKWTPERHVVEPLRIALESISSYRLRAGLSSLGVVIGVACVIAVMSVTEGAREETLRQVESLGLDNIVLRDSFAIETERMTLRDAERLHRLTPLASIVTPVITRPVAILGPLATRQSLLLGVGPDYDRVLRLSVRTGRFLADLDEDSNSRVCVLGARLASELFGLRNPLHESIRIDSNWYRVVGVLDTTEDVEGEISMAVRDLNSLAIVPLSTALGHAPGADPSTPIDEIWIHIDDGDRVEEVGRVVERSLTLFHDSRGGVEVVVPRALLRQRLRTQRTFGIVVGSMAALALLVGGIGIMNVTLASVLERTTEIGVRRAVGASRFDIVLQFLVEVVLMAVTGGIAGIGLGVTISLGVSTYAGWTTLVSPATVLVAFFVSVSIGLVFGIYPASRAARLPPVEALRKE